MALLIVTCSVLAPALTCLAHHDTGRPWIVVVPTSHSIPTQLTFIRYDVMGGKGEL